MLKTCSTVSVVSSMNQGWRLSNALCVTVEMTMFFLPSGALYQCFFSAKRSRISGFGPVRPGVLGVCCRICHCANTMNGGFHVC